jgi:GT2 family glycosyltransferase
MMLSVVIVSRNEGQRLASTLDSLARTLRRSDEIVIVDDGSTDGSGNVPNPGPARMRVIRTEGLGACRARNLGAGNASGDVLVFSDAHMSYTGGWWEPLISAVERDATGAAAPAIADLEQPSRIGYGMRFAGPALGVKWLPRPTASPAHAPVLPGACLAMRTDLFQTMGGFDEGLIQWGVEDCEISIRIWLSGYDLVLVPECSVRHFFRSEHPYEVKWTSVLHNKLRLASVHFDERRAALVKGALCGHAKYEEALALLDSEAIAQRRSELLARRVRTPEEYFTFFEHDW